MYSKEQKNFLNFLLNYKKNEIELCFSEVLYEYILKFYKGIIIEFENNIINFYKLKNYDIELNTSEIKRFQEEIVSILYLIYELYSKKNLIFYGEIKEIKNKYLDLIEEDRFLFKMKLDFFRKIKSSILKNYIISSELKELEERDFNSIEEKNLNFTKWALIISIIATGIGIFSQWYIAIKVTTVIEFSKPEQLKNASSTTIINMKK